MKTKFIRFIGRELRMIRLYRMLENVWFGWPQKLRFLLTGGFNTVFSYGLFVLMVAAIGIPYKIAIAAGYIISTNVSIFTMRYYVFRSKGSLKKEYAKAWGVYLTTMLINYAAMYAMVDLGAGHLHGIDYGFYLSDAQVFQFCQISFIRKTSCSIQSQAFRLRNVLSGLGLLTAGMFRVRNRVY